MKRLALQKKRVAVFFGPKNFSGVLRNEPLVSKSLAKWKTNKLKLNRYRGQPLTVCGIVLVFQVIPKLLMNGTEIQILITVAPASK